MYIDSHAHLFYADFGNDLPDVIGRARDAGVEFIIVPGTDLRTSAEALELAGKYDFIRACVGFHPHEAAKVTDTLLQEIESMSKDPRVVAIGEIGLDYHYDFSPRDSQIPVFKQQIELAVQKNLPIVVHTRESLNDTVHVVGQIIQSHPHWKDEGEGVLKDRRSARGVFHCFTGTHNDANSLFGMGFQVSYPGIVTFKNSPVAETLRSIGCEHILLETDSPYMAPVPERGKRNEPANIVHIGKKIAEILALPLYDVAKITSSNSMHLFGLK